MKKIFKTIAVLLCMLTVMNIMTPGIYAAAADTADTAPSTAGEEVNLVYGYHSVTAGRAGTVKVNDFTLKTLCRIRASFHRRKSGSRFAFHALQFKSV